MAQPNEDEELARLLKEYTEEVGPSTTKDRLGEIAVLAEISEMASLLLNTGKRLSLGENFTTAVFRAEVLAVLKRVQDGTLDMMKFIRTLEANSRSAKRLSRRSSIPPKRQR